MAGAGLGPTGPQDDDDVVNGPWPRRDILAGERRRSSGTMLGLACFLGACLAVFTILVLAGWLG